MKALAVASGIVFWTLVLGAIVLIFFPGGNQGEPIAVLQIEAAPPSRAPAAPATTDGVDLPPGFSVTGPSVAPVAPRPVAPMPPPGLGSPTVPTVPAPPPPGPSGAPETPGRQGAAPGPGGETVVAAADVAVGVDLTGGAALGAVLSPALSRESGYGPADLRI